MHVLLYTLSNYQKNKLKKDSEMFMNRKSSGRSESSKSKLFGIFVQNTNIPKEHVFESFNELCSKFILATQKTFGKHPNHRIYIRTYDQYNKATINEMTLGIYNISESNAALTNGLNRAQTSRDSLTQSQTFNISISETLNSSNDEDIFSSLGDESIANGDTNSTLVQVKFIQNERSYIKCITKEDHEPIVKGVPDDMLSFYYKCMTWAKNSDTYKLDDPFVLNHPNYYKLLRELHSSIVENRSMRNKKVLRPVYDVQLEPSNQTRHSEPYPIFTMQNSVVLTFQTNHTYSITNYNQFKQWHLSVIEWWNDWAVNGYSHKKKQLYLWGPSNSGKTTFVNRLLARCINDLEETDEHAYECQIYTPIPNEKRFAWQEFDSKIYNVVFIDEFDLNEYNVSDLKKALAGESFVANRKGISPKKILVQMPTILVSNLSPPSNNGPDAYKYQGVLERLNIVYCE